MYPRKPSYFPIHAPRTCAGRPGYVRSVQYVRSVSIRAPHTRAGRRHAAGPQRAHEGVSIRAPRTRAGRPGMVWIYTTLDVFQSAPRARARGDCGPPSRLSRKHFLAPFRQPANPSRTLTFRYVKERWKMPAIIVVASCREIPVAGPSLVVRGMAFIQSMVRSDPLRHRQTVSQPRTEFLHQIQRQPRTVRAVGVEKPDKRIEADAGQSRDAIMPHQRV